MSFNKYRLKGAYHYDWYETEDWYKYFIDRAVGFCKGSTIDVGCGEGLLVSKIKANGFNAIGIDSDPTAIELALQSGIEVHNYNIDETELRVICDYMACLNTIEHLNNPERLADFIRNYVTKGAIITTIDYQGGALGEDHKREYTYDELLDFFKEFKPKGFRYKDTEWIGVEIRKDA